METSPLIMGRDSPKQGPVYKYGSDDGSVEFDERPQTIRQRVGLILQKSKWLAGHLTTGYYVLLVNSLCMCAFIIYAKALQSDDYFTKLYHRFAPLGNWGLQIADVLLVCSYSLDNFLYLRLSLLVACLCFIVYSCTSPLGIMLDLLFFNLVMALLNTKHAISLLYEKRYVKFNPEFEQVYSSIFADFMRRTDFSTLISIALVRQEKSHVVLKEKGDTVTSLCVLVKGRVLVTNSSGRKINEYGRNEFLESPEWVKCDLKPDDNCRFQITFTTVNECVYIKWPRETLLALLEMEGNNSLKLALRAVLGIQTARIWLRSIEIKEHTPPSRASPQAVRTRESSGGGETAIATIVSPTSRQQAGIFHLSNQTSVAPVHRHCVVQPRTSQDYSHTNGISHLSEDEGKDDTALSVSPEFHDSPHTP